MCESFLLRLLYLQEDFQPMSYGFKMAGDVTDSRALGMLKEVEDELFKLCKVRRSCVCNFFLDMACEICST